MIRHTSLGLAFLVTGSLALTGCGGSGSGSGNGTVDAPVFQGAALIVTTPPTFQGSDIELVDLNASTLQAVPGIFSDVESDVVVVTWKSDFYRLGRFNLDNITKRNLASPTFNEWQFSAFGASDTTSPNLNDLVFEQDTKAFLIRYGSAQVWIVNPEVTANQEAEFKTGEIDLSAYGDQDGIPELAGGVIHDGKLFIIAQRLDATQTFWEPSNTAYVIVIDLATNAEIDTGRDPGGLKGIPLQSRNPQQIVHVPGVGIVVQSVGSFVGIYEGGIEVINPDTYANDLRIDDGDAEDHPLGLISNMAIVNEQTGFLVGYTDWQVTSLYKFNPRTGEVSATPVANYADIDISALAVDPAGQLWVGLGDAQNPRVEVLNPQTEQREATISLLNSPRQIHFAGELQ